MQTFLPYPSFTLSAICLDNKRLNKQILECDQILNALAPGSTSGWRNHPAVKMWRGYEPALLLAIKGACSMKRADVDFILLVLSLLVGFVLVAWSIPGTFKILGAL